MSEVKATKQRGWQHYPVELGRDVARMEQRSQRAVRKRDVDGGAIVDDEEPIGVIGSTISPIDISMCLQNAKQQGSKAS